MKRVIAILAMLVMPVMIPHYAYASTQTDKCAVQAQLTGSTVNFTVPAGCTQTVSLASYSAPGPKFDMKTVDQQKLIDIATGTFTAGSNKMTVKLPPCFYQVDFVYGKPIMQLSKTNMYVGRLIATEAGGKACANVTATTIPRTTTTIAPVVQHVTTTTVPITTSTSIVKQAMALTGSNTARDVGFGAGLSGIGIASMCGAVWLRRRFA